MVEAAGKKEDFRYCMLAGQQDRERRSNPGRRMVIALYLGLGRETERKD